MTARLLLDEHYGPEIARQLRAEGHDVVAVVENTELRTQSDAELFQRAAHDDRRIVSENIKDFRPLLVNAYNTGDPIARLLLVGPRRFPRGSGNRTRAIVAALTAWLSGSAARGRPDEDWLT